ncbi:putative short-subunit dehydrogenase-like oxidoreductase (DUF2520 family) [Microbacterium foliorum]|uniref:Rossmann-like and DUF2520 domain-containing protein n=1 Tax=Microbacterium foliorum TaxID=104336 RepID=UPI0020A0071A|nr:Rossmann-like and DUF2520 domain-containing protein [Microbacterium foliorum]MCP1428570.1 putative short-subunit dehydrogenase-like oxidoreductase (DUF2520 family) [Microbacterium foliorum]
MHSTPALPSETTIAIVGAGRLGGVLARALHAAGLEIVGPLRRGEPIPPVDLAILCVPDAAIPAAAESARGSAARVAHVSGATGLGDVDLSIHPLQTLTGAESPTVFRGVGAAIDGRTADDRARAARLATTLGLVPFRVDDAHRASYHAAASFASNFVLTVLDAAEELAATAGVDRAHLAPLVRQTVDNWAVSGAAAALTGPIARGDEETVARQRAASAHLAPLFDALAASTRAIARTAPRSVVAVPGSAVAAPGSAVAAPGSTAENEAHA